MSVKRFNAMVEAAALVSLSARFSQVIVVEYGDGFIYETPRQPDMPPSVREQA